MGDPLHSKPKRFLDMRRLARLTGMASESQSSRARSLECRPLRRRRVADLVAREVEVQIDFTGFVIPDKFVIGYGLDYAGLYRELPGIYSLS